jgi:cytochrome c556
MMVLAAALMAIAGFGWIGTWVQADASKHSSTVMRAKLEQAQAILEGLSMEEFKLIEDNAKKLSAVTEFEEWIHAKDKDYQHQLHVFRTANEEIFRQATEKNLDGATLAYMQMTLSCVQCHKAMRAKK